MDVLNLTRIARKKIEIKNLPLALAVVVVPFLEVVEVLGVLLPCQASVVEVVHFHPYPALAAAEVALDRPL